MGLDPEAVEDGADEEDNVTEVEAEPSQSVVKPEGGETSTANEQEAPAVGGIEELELDRDDEDAAPRTANDDLCAIPDAYEAPASSSRKSLNASRVAVSSVSVDFV